MAETCDSIVETQGQMRVSVSGGRGEGGGGEGGGI